MNNAFREINGAIEIAVQKYCQNLGYDYSFQGIVISIESGICTVSLNGELTQCKILHGAMFEVGDIVLVNVNKNNFSDKYVYGKYGDVFDEGATIVTWNNVTNKPIFSTVSLTGSYNDLVDKPDIYTRTEVNSLLNTYTHSQITSSDTWTITHNLGRFPSVTVVDSGGTVCVGDIDYVSNNQLVITFKGVFAGLAYLN